MSLDPSSRRNWLGAAVVLTAVAGLILVTSSLGLATQVGPAGRNAAGGSIAQSADLPPPPPTYQVTFTESVLPAGSNWNVTVLGVAWNSMGTSLVVFVANGSYTYIARSEAAPGNWSADGSFDVSGRPVTVAVPLVSPSIPAAGTSAAATGLALDWLLPVLGVVLFAVVAVVAVLGMARRARGPPSAPPPSSPTPTADPPLNADHPRPSGESEADPLRHML
jgi:hypothetical protein